MSEGLAELLAGARPWWVEEGDCAAILPALPDGRADAVVTDPPYDLLSASRNGSPRVNNDPAKPSGRRAGGFMGMAWDATGVACRPDTWRSALSATRPGGYLLAFGGTRTHHRLTCAIEDAGWEIRDCLMWIHGQGFPKGAGCLKPAYEPIVLARRPGPRVLPLGIDGCRVGTSKEVPASPSTASLNGFGLREGRKGVSADNPGHDPHTGRYPANVLHDGTDEVLGAFAAFGGKDARDGAVNNRKGDKLGYRGGSGAHEAPALYGDAGTAARFFFCAKASRAERSEGLKHAPSGPDAHSLSSNACGRCGLRVKANGSGRKCECGELRETVKLPPARNHHPCVKPVALMCWLVRLVTPEGGLCLDPFCGSGTTGVACRNLGRRFLGIERVPEYAALARRRIAAAAPLLDHHDKLQAKAAAQRTLFGEAAP